MKKYLFLPILVMISIFEQIHAVTYQDDSVTYSFAEYQDKGENNTLLFLVLIGILAYIIFILYRIYKRDLQIGEIGANIKKTLIKVCFINNYKEYLMVNILYMLLLVIIFIPTGVFIFIALSKGSIVTLGYTLFFGSIAMFIIRAMMEALSRGANRFIHSGSNSNQESISTSNKGSRGGFITFLASIGIVVSFFIPMLVGDGKSSYSLIQMFDKYPYVAELLSSFFWQSVLAAISIFIGYIQRGKLLSLIGLFGIFFYARALLSMFSHSKSTANVFRILENIGLSKSEIGEMAFSSPGLLLYVISSFFLILACFAIIGGYIRFFNEKKQEA